MDEAIRKLKSTTFFSRRLTRHQIADIQRTVRECAGLSRHELGLTICEHLNWHTPGGAPRAEVCNALNDFEPMQLRLVTDPGEVGQ